MKKTKKIIAIGEVLWDLFPDGRKVGGAPGNFAFHCAQLGADVTFVSAVGRDMLGRELLRYFTQMGLSTEAVAVLPDYPTGTVRVEFENGEPVYTIRENVAWDHLEISGALLERIVDADVLYFGSLVSRTEKMQRLLQHIFEAVPKSTLKVFDVNLRAPFYRRDSLLPLLKKADILKLNKNELAILSGMLGFEAAPEEELADRLQRKFGYELLVLTDGPGGALLLTENDRSLYAPVPVRVVDTVGAGDSFAAQTVVGWLNRLPIDEINRLANDLAAFVCTCQGGTPRHTKLLRSPILVR